jgi:hypothetical protein
VPLRQDALLRDERPTPERLVVHQPWSVVSDGRLVVCEEDPGHEVASDRLPPARANVSVVLAPDQLQLVSGWNR